MSKKFDVVIGNPPYQEEAQGDGTRDTPVYHLFMDAAYKVGRKAVLITPARFLFNAGFTPKAWNEKMLADPHLSVPIYEPSSDRLFPGTDIKAGIAVTYRDETALVEPIGTFTKHAVLNDILHKVGQKHERSIGPEITSSRSYRYTPALYEANPDLRSLRPRGNEALISTNTFTQFASLFSATKPDDGMAYARVEGLAGPGRREDRWIRGDFVTGPASFATFKVVVAKANGSGVFGEALSGPHVADPQVAVTQSFITIGSFESRPTAVACLKYIKSKFARSLLGVLKVTQDNPAATWKYVPTQDFTSASEIDWSKSIAEIDLQLYAKYGLDDEEIVFIEANVKPMS